MKVSIDFGALHKQLDAEEAGYDFGAGLEALWEGAKLAPANTLASFAQAYQGATLNDGGPVEEFIQGVKLRNEEYLADDGDNLSKLVPLPGDDITVGTEKQALGSAGFTLAGMLSSAVGGAAGTATRIPGMGYVGAALTSLPVLQRAAANEALRAIRDVVSGPFEEENGRKMDAIDWLPLEEQYRATANEKGFNEAWPEMLGNLLTFGIIRAKSIPLVSNALKGVVAKSPKLFKGLNVLGKYGAIAGTEVGTEAVTEKFNREADIKAGLETDPLSWGEAVQSVAPVSLTMAGLTAGLGGGLSLAYDKTIGRDSTGKPKKIKPKKAKPEQGDIADIPTEAELEDLLAEITDQGVTTATVVPEAHRMDAQNLQAEQSAQAELGEALATVEKANAEEATAQELNAALETVEREEGPQKFLGEGVDATDYPLIDSQDIPADAVLVGYDLDLNYIYQGVDEAIYRAQERRPEKAFATQQILDDTETSQTQEQRDADFQREINRAEHGVTRGIKVGDALDPRLDPNLGIDQQELIITDAMVMDGIEADLNNGSAPTRGYAGVENYTDGGYPDWFSNKGYNKKDSLHAIDLARNRKPMTLIQKALLTDLMNGKRSELKQQQDEYINTVRTDRLAAIRAENDAAQSQADLAVEREAIQGVELGQTNNELQVLEDQNRQREAEITARELDAREQVLNGETVTEEITEAQPQEEVGTEGEESGEVKADLPSVETGTVQSPGDTSVFVTSKEEALVIEKLKGEKNDRTLRSLATKYYNMFLRGRTANHPQVGAVSFVRRGRNKTINTSANTLKLKVLPDLVELIEGAEYIDRQRPNQPDKKRFVEWYHKLTNTAEINGEQYDITILLEERADGTIHYNHELTEIEKGDKPTVSHGGSAKAEANPADAGLSPSSDKKIPEKSPEVKAGHYVKYKSSGAKGGTTSWELVTDVVNGQVTTDRVKTFFTPEITDHRTGSPDMGRGVVLVKDGAAVKVMADLTTPNFSLKNDQPSARSGERGLHPNDFIELAAHMKDIGGQNIDIIPMDEIIVDTDNPKVREKLQAHGMTDADITKFSRLGSRVAGGHGLKRATTGEIRSIIKISLRDADMVTGYHEVMHRLMDLALDGKQVDFLLKKFGSIENIADEYGARLNQLRKRGPVGKTEQIFAKIMEFIESIRNFATAKGWNSESRLAREIDEGVYAEVADNADITPTTERFSLTQKTEGDAITGQVNTSMAGVDLKYDGAQLNIRDKPVYHLFTVYAGPAQGATFTSKELTFDAVQTALNTKIAQFEQSYALPAHATNRGAYAANLVSEIKGIQSSLATATPAESKDLAAQLQAKAEELQTLVADYKDTPDAAETVAEVDPRSVGVKLFKDRDRAEHYAKVDADTMEREVQRLADSIRGRKGPFAMDIVKASDKSRFLSRAMMIYRDLKNFESEGGNVQEKVAWGLTELNKQADATKNKITKKKILDKIKIIQASQVLTIEQKEFVDNMVDAKFKEVEALAIDNDLIKEGKDNYVRRIWSLTDADGASYESSGSNGFKVTTKAGEKRTLDTIIDGWERGYELKAGMIQNSYREIATEIGTIASNKGFLRWGLSEKTPDGDPLFTTKKLQGYAPLTASGFQVYTPAGKVEIGVEGEPGDIRSYGDIELESDSYGRRVFITKPQGAMKDSVIVFAPAQIYAPKEVADVINKMTDGKSALREIPAISKALDITSALKGWILMVSLFHHRAGATSWLFGVPHGGQINFVKAYKNGIQKIRDKADIVDLGVRNGLTLYGNQDHQEMFKGDTSVITNVIEKYNLDSINKIAEVAGKIRGGYADALFNKFFAGLKAEAFDKTFNKVLKANPTQDQEVLAEQVATVINADFGGLHLGRMGRNKTVQDILRLGLLAPDWSESNFRTVFGMIPGNKLNKFVDKMMDGVPAVKGMETHYREFWLRAAVGIIMTTGIAQFLAAGGDPEEVYEFHKQMFNQWEKGRNLAVDITPFYRMMGIDIPENQKMTFSIAGHFADPLKLADPARLIKGKESPGMRIVESLLTGSDWAERPYTSFSQLLAGEGTIKKSRFQQKEGSLSRLASTTLNTMMNMQPIAIGNMVKVIMGDEDPLTGVLASSGMHIGRTWLKDESNERYNEAREKILKYNRDVKGLDDEAKTQLQKDIFGTAGEYLRVKEQYKRVKSGLRALNKRFDAVEGTDAEHGVKEDISALKDNFAEVVTSGVGAISAPSTGRSLKGRSLSTRSLKPRTLRR